MNGRPLHVNAAIGVVACIVVFAVLLKAPYFVVLAVPFAIGIGVAGRSPRAAAVVIAVSSAFVVVLVGLQLAGGPEGKDAAFDVVAGLLCLLALAGSMSALRGSTSAAA